MNTQDLHQQVEHHDWVRGLYHGQLSLAHYQNYLIQLWAVYACLEALLKDNQSLELYLPELLRTESIQQDLDGIVSLDSQRKVLADNHYVMHLNSIPKQKAYLLISHFYVLYFGGLLGGPTIKQLVQNHFKCDADVMNFYDFRQFHSVYPDGVDALRSLIDSIPLNRKQQNEVIQEAKTAFKLTYQIMSDSLISP